MLLNINAGFLVVKFFESIRFTLLMNFTSLSSVASGFVRPLTACANLGLPFTNITYSLPPILTITACSLFSLAEARYFKRSLLPSCLANPCACNSFMCSSCCSTISFTSSGVASLGMSGIERTHSGSFSVPIFSYHIPFTDNSLFGWFKARFKNLCFIRFLLPCKIPLSAILPIVANGSSAIDFLPLATFKGALKLVLSEVIYS